MSENPLRLAVVVPALNEEQSLPQMLRSLADQTEPAERLVVADGGSRDRTVSVARTFGAEAVSAPNRGRGGQIAVALAQLDEDLILIGHADMLFPREALAAVRLALGDDPACPGGCLGHRFEPRRFVYDLIAWYDGCRARWGHSYGDQAQFFRRAKLARLGGFPDQPIMEDLELSRCLHALGRPCYLNVPVTVSARRFERLGWGRVLWRNWRFRRAYRRGGLAACQAIYEQYYALDLAKK